MRANLRSLKRTIRLSSQSVNVPLSGLMTDPTGGSVLGEQLTLQNATGSESLWGKHVRTYQYEAEQNRQN
jgi:hypothetical protein